MKFDELIIQIEQAHQSCVSQAAQQVNTYHTIRNWLIGYYIITFEQNGEERAAYGQKYMELTAQRLKHIRGMAVSNLKNFRQFYLTYSWLSEGITTALQKQSGGIPPIRQTVSGELGSSEEKRERELALPAETLLNTLSFSHFIELLRVETDLKRRFYEVQSVQSAWSVRELSRAIDTLLYERTGLSTDKRSVIRKMKAGQEVPVPELIKNPYLLEFLGLEEKAEFSENDLETAIITHLQTFLTELGRGFCFEARQKRITFGNTHYRIDLVFYHRILKCHVLIDLKLGKYDHSDSGQMNLYLNYYRKNEMTQGDNPPLGIILCADKDDALVEYMRCLFRNTWLNCPAKIP
jgi:predicted nuclease of restriction endonuclease-like (RecB) superfamily